MARTKQTAMKSTGGRSIGNIKKSPQRRSDKSASWKKFKEKSKIRTLSRGGTSL